MASTNNLVMEKQADQQLALKCPRCDSSNTKFCYYNNYSLLQPRYFCKGCKRYWTRGGTLRNVPVGGGCRKNKRVKKVAVVPPVVPVDYVPSSPISTQMTSTTTITNPNSSSGHSINNIFPLLYDLHSNVSSFDHNLSFTRFDSSALYNNIQQPDQVNVLGLSSASRMATTDHVSTSESIFSNYVATTPMFRSCNSSISVSPTMTSLIKPNYLDQENSVDPDCNNVFSFVPNYVDMQMQGNNSSQTRSNQMEATNDLDSLFCVGGWFDSGNIGSSVPLM